MGVTLYNLVCGADPFSDYTSKEMRHVEFCPGLSSGEEPAGEGRAAFGHTLLFLCQVILFLCFSNRSQRFNFLLLESPTKKTGPP